MDHHIKACKKKWETDQGKLPAGQRRLMPIAPTNFDQTVEAAKKGEKIDLDAVNSESFSVYNNQSLEACPNCKRTFNKESLEKHVRMCKGSSDVRIRAGGISQMKSDIQGKI